ncbi:MAG: hypothetical protein LBV08_00815 [Clostridiales bacterium]|jgi:hypothetical protein|nr:hypothetical protein [Clostridiales bacterium]
MDNSIFDDRAMALCELSQDMLFHKVPVGRILYYIDEPLKAGRDAARLYSGKDIHALYSENGIGAEYKPKTASAFGVMLRGQAILGADGCKVEIYMESIEELAKHSCFGGMPGLDLESALKVHLAHEFYHYLEYKSGSAITEMLDSVETFKLFGFTRKAKINRCSEIAAHMFAKCLIGLSYMPNLYDYLYLISTGKLTAGDFEEKISGLKQLAGV